MDFVSSTALRTRVRRSAGLILAGICLQKEELVRAWISEILFLKNGFHLCGSALIQSITIVESVKQKYGISLTILKHF